MGVVRSCSLFLAALFLLQEGKKITQKHEGNGEERERKDGGRKGGRGSWKEE